MRVPQDVASASYFDGFVRWYENLDGVGGSWQNHTLYVGSQGHYVSTADLDDDGDEDLISVTKSENRVQVFYAVTSCDSMPAASCCRLGTAWSGSACVACAAGTYGVLSGGQAACATVRGHPSPLARPQFMRLPPENMCLCIRRKP